MVQDEAGREEEEYGVLKMLGFILRTVGLR